MHKISLKDWVILLTILPTTLISVCIAGYFSYTRYVELNEFLDERSTSIIEPLAIASLTPITSRDREKLRNLISFAHRSQSSIVKSIAVFTKDNQVFVTSVYHGDTNLLRLQSGNSLPMQTTSETLGDFIIYRTPIIDETLMFGDDDMQTSRKSTVGYVALQVDKSKIKFHQQSEILIAFAITLFGSVISALFAARLIKNVTRPVTSMVQAVERIREGKRESRVSGQLIGELNFLKNGINAMAQSLGDYHDEMQRSIDQATIDLRESLEQFEIQNVELDISKRKAQEANRVKSEFLANMSHELRTPLNGVIGFTRQLLKTPLSEVQRDYLQTIERSANNLLVIINDILDFSKLDAGKMVIESLPFSMRESVEECLALLAPMAHKKNIELSFKVSSQLPDSFIGDAMRIKQIITNLANNAIKFTDIGSIDIDVEIDATAEGLSDDQLVIKVSVNDTGIGMSKQQQGTIFEAFGQADKSVTRLYGGTGLGLVISQRLAHEMNGDIGFTSEPQQGSNFWFTFTCEINPVPLLEHQDYSELNGKTVLYYEPHAHARIATIELLSKWKMQVAQVTNLEQLGQAIAAKRLYDFVLLSHGVSPSELNELKGLLQAVRHISPSLHVAINSNSPNLQEALMSSGALSCISKPITHTKLTKSLLPQQFVATSALTSFSDNKVPLKVLAVDDNEANLKLIKALLLEQVTDVTTAVNGEEAVEYCKNEKFALIYMDIQMPVMDGITALKTIRSNTFNDDTPIIAVTAHALATEKEKLLQLGFDSYMTKPIDESMLKHTLYEYCNLELLSDSLNESNADSISTKSAKPVTSSFLKQLPEGDTSVIDWKLALKRAGNNESLAKEMFQGLIDSLPEAQSAIEQAIEEQNIDSLRTLIHKLNGACCYSGVPNLAKITMTLETGLKKEHSIEVLEPEFLEFFEQIENVLEASVEVLSNLAIED